MGIGKQLADEAARRGISHEEAGRIIGVSQSTFSRWVTGETLVRSEHWGKVARFLHVPREELSTVVAQERARRSARGATERIEVLEREVDGLRKDIAELANLVRQRLGNGR